MLGEECGSRSVRCVTAAATAGDCSKALWRRSLALSARGCTKLSGFAQQPPAAAVQAGSRNQAQLRQAPRQVCSAPRTSVRGSRTCTALARLPVGDGRERRRRRERLRAHQADVESCLSSNAGMARTKQTRRKSIAPKQPPRRLASPDPSDDESSDDEPAGGSEARFQDARPCAICGGPVLQETEYNEDGRGSQPSHAWLQDACVLKAGEDKPPPWERKQLRRDVHAAAAERRHDAGAAGSRWREAAEAEDEAPPSPTDSGYDTWRYESCQYGAINFDPLGDEDEHGDWDWVRHCLGALAAGPLRCAGPRWGRARGAGCCHSLQGAPRAAHLRQPEQELRLMRRMTFYADARMDGNWVRAGANIHACSCKHSCCQCAVPAPRHAASAHAS